MHRLMLMILVLLLAVPATAAPHCAPSAPPVHGATHHQQDEPQVPDVEFSLIHGCIGCAAPSQISTATLKGTETPDRHIAEHALTLVGRLAAPESPPPRHG